MLTTEATKNVQTLYDALRNQSIRSGRDATVEQKAAASLLAYFKALPSIEHNVATLAQLVKACELIGLIEKPLTERVIHGRITVANGLWKTSQGMSTQQIRLMQYLYLPDSEDMMKLHKLLTDNSQGIEKYVLRMVQEIADDVTK